MHLLVSPAGYVVGVRRSVPDFRVYVARDVEEAWLWQVRMREGEPLGLEGPGYAISAEGMTVLRDEIRREQLPVPEGLEDWEAELAERCSFAYRLGPLGLRFIACATSFRSFLDVWRFKDLDTGEVKVLGECLWAGQETFVSVVTEHPWVYHLKNRQIGYTTMAVAYDAWVLRFRAPNARVHLVSRTEDLAKKNILKPLKFGVERLPAEMALPVVGDTATTLELEGGPDDRRVAQAYAAKEPGRADTCMHLHLDEWAAMGKTSPGLPLDVWSAAEPTISKRGGTCHILCTGQGPIGYYADVWRLCEKGEGQLFASFIPATGARPEYTADFLARKRATAADKTKVMWEYPETPEDALAGGGDTRYPEADVNAAAQYARGLGPARTWIVNGRERKRRYVKAWDMAGPGPNADAVVGIVLDVTEPTWDVVGFIYNRGETYPVSARRIEAVHEAYPGPTVIEDNESGAAVRSFLNIPAEGYNGAHGQRVTPQMKAVMIDEVGVALAYQVLKWNPQECAQLDREVRRYKLPDEGIEQDCVMALAHGVYFAVHKLPELVPGTMLGAVHV